jgi:hypothetical protein
VSPARIVSAVLLAGTGLTAGLALSGVEGPVRLVATIGFFLLAPGWAVTATVSPPGPAAVTSARWAVAVAVSAGLDALIAETMLLLGWYPVPAFGALLAVSAVLLAGHLGIRRGRAG